MVNTCPFCHLSAAEYLFEEETAIVIRDASPLTAGHCLIIPRRHISSFFQTTAEEREALWSLLAKARKQLIRTCRPDGFNIGINDGVAAGQTVHHLHIHLIPRYADDCPDPRGGIRWIFPDKAAYWS